MQREQTITLVLSPPAPPFAPPCPTPPPRPASPARQSPLGPWTASVQVIQNWTNSSWNLGNWNPAPVMLPDGRVRIMAHTDWAGWAGVTILEAPSYAGPYTVKTGDELDHCAFCEEDPFMQVPRDTPQAAVGIDHRFQNCHLASLSKLLTPKARCKAHAPVSRPPTRSQVGGQAGALARGLPPHVRPVGAPGPPLGRRGRLVEPQRLQGRASPRAG